MASLANQLPDVQVDSQKPATKSKRASPLSGEPSINWLPDIAIVVMVSEWRLLAELQVERAAAVAMS